jgi:hypothetical protein
VYVGELVRVDAFKVALKLSDTMHTCNSIIDDGMVSKFHEGHEGESAHLDAPILLLIFVCGPNPGLNRQLC